MIEHPYGFRQLSGSVGSLGKKHDKMEFFKFEKNYYFSDALFGKKKPVAGRKKSTELFYLGRDKTKFSAVTMVTFQRAQSSGGMESSGNRNSGILVMRVETVTFDFGCRS